MKRIVISSLLSAAALFLAACAGTGGAGTSSSPRDASSATRVTTAINATFDTRASEPTVAAPHGQEIASGTVVTVTDGNVRMAFPETAIITRTAQGVVVTSHGRTRTFSAAAVVSATGTYHEYAPVRR